MPPKAGKGGAKIIFQAEVHDEITEREGFLLRPDGPGEFQRIDPRTKAVKGKRAQESPLGGRAMRDYPAILEKAMDLRPEVRQLRRSGEIFRTDAMDLSSCPSDRLIGKEEAGEAFGNFELLHQRNPDLHGHFGTSPPDPGALKIDRCERGLGNNHALGLQRSRIAQLFQDHALALRLEPTEQLLGHLPIHTGIGD